MTFRDDASLRKDLNGLTPRLRRYARALTSGCAAPSELADDLVHATLMRALGARDPGLSSELAIRLYATLTQLHRELAVSGRQARVAGGARPVVVPTGRNSIADRQTKLGAALLSLPLEAREALLLVGLEGLDHAAAARTLRVSRAVLLSRLTQARTGLDLALQAAPVRPSRSATHLRLVSSRS